jgi:hypothetical protein
MNREQDPYLPMKSVISADPGPPMPEFGGEEIGPGDFSLRVVAAETARLFRLHWRWGLAAVALPQLTMFVYILLGELAPAANAGDSLASAMAGLGVLLLAAPLLVAVDAALIWRTAESGPAGRLDRGPLSGLFLGFRFFKQAFLADLVLGFCFILAAAPAWVVKGFLLGSDAFAGGALGVLWAVFVALAALALTVYSWAAIRWSLVLPAAVFENLGFTEADRRVSALLRGRTRQVLPVGLVLAILSRGLDLAIKEAPVWLARFFDIGGPRVRLAWIVVYAAISMLTWLLGVVIAVACYKVLRASAVTRT